MHPSYENTAPEDLDFRFKTIIDELKSRGFRVSLDAAVDLHWWLSERKDERILEGAIEEILGRQSTKQQIGLCADLANAAELIAKQFDFLNELSSLNIALSQAYTANAGTTTGESHALRSRGCERWSDFRTGLRNDAEALAAIAKQTRKAIADRGSKRGPPAEAWKNLAITDLVDRLPALIEVSMEERVPLACMIWNIYFPEDELDSERPEAVAKRIAREHVRRKSQGHVSPISGPSLSLRTNT